MSRWLVIVLLAACKVPDPPPITEHFVDSFDRAELGQNYRPTSSAYRIERGELVVDDAFNHPLWLRKKLPKNAIIEFDCWSEDTAGDIKVELYGDGESYAESKTGQYTASGYVAVFGGWNNTKSILARGNEHGNNLEQRNEPKVQPGKKYHFKFERNGQNIVWYVEDMSTPFLKLIDRSDSIPAGHDYFAFSDWQSRLRFDNLSITPL